MRSLEESVSGRGSSSILEVILYVNFTLSLRSLKDREEMKRLLACLMFMRHFICVLLCDLFILLNLCVQ